MIKNSLTTNHEHGYWLGKMWRKMVYGRPDDSYRNTYLDLMWELDAEQSNSVAPPIFNTLEGTVLASVNIACSVYDKRKNRVKSKIFVDSPYGAF